MKFLGHDTVGCQCHYCIGPNGSKPARRAIKKRGRQAAKKELRRDLDTSQSQTSSSRDKSQVSSDHDSE